MKNKVTIIGKPNVGKSTLFNSIVGKKLALVKDIPGLTRDIRKHEISFLNSKYIIIDTAGVTQDGENFNENILRNTKDLINTSNLILFIIDAKNPLSKEDFQVNEIIRNLNKKTILIINKAESKINDFLRNEFPKLGLKNYLFVSAEHNIGILELKNLINQNLIFEKNETNKSEKNFDHTITIIGQTNTGKSTLINSLKGENISITGKTNNLTRDPVETIFKWKTKIFKIIDTAGLSSKKRKIDEIDKISIFETKRKLRLSQITMVVIDIENYYEKYNFKLLKRVIDEGRCLVIVINKIDKKKDISKQFIINYIYKLLPELKSFPIYFISSLKKLGIDELMNGIMKILPIWSKRLNTGKLNLWLNKVIKNKPHPLYKGKEVRFKFITQVNSSPPKFVIFSNFPKIISDHYKRFLINNLKKDLGFQGVVVRLNFKRSGNPYG